MMDLVSIALNEIGTKEIVGSRHNPVIVRYAKETGLKWVNDDETPWCSIFLYWVVSKLPDFSRVDRPGLDRAAASRSWQDCGVEVPTEKRRLGDIVVFWRGSKSGWKGHVGIYINDTPDKEGYINILGGNQDNSVSIKGYSTTRILSVRRL